MLTENLRSDAPDFFFVPHLSRSRGQVTEHLPSSIFDNALRAFQASRQDAAHIAIVISNRAIRKREVTFLKVIVSVERKHLVGELAGVLTSSHNLVESRSDVIPGLG